MQQDPVPVKQIAYLSSFACLMDKCPDMCCREWNIRLSEHDRDVFKNHAPELLDSIVTGIYSPYEMRKNQHGECVQLHEGKCRIHANYGEDMLPDICHAYPRKFIKVDDEVYIVASLSCPESLRIALYSNSPDDFLLWHAKESNRVRDSIHSVKTNDQGTALAEGPLPIYTFMQSVISKKDYSAEEALSRLIYISFQLDNKGSASSARLQDMLQHDEFIQQMRILNRIPEEAMKQNLMQLLEFIFAVIPNSRITYFQFLQHVDTVFGNHLDEATRITANYARLKTNWDTQKPLYDAILKNLLRVQLSRVLFPEGVNQGERMAGIQKIALEFLVIKTALMCLESDVQTLLPSEEIISLLQTITKQFQVVDPVKCDAFLARSSWSDYNQLMGMVLNY